MKNRTRILAGTALGVVMTTAQLGAAPITLDRSLLGSNAGMAKVAPSSSDLPQARIILAQAEGDEELTEEERKRLREERRQQRQEERQERREERQEAPAAEEPAPAEEAERPPAVPHRPVPSSSMQGAGRGRARAVGPDRRHAEWTARAVRPYRDEARARPTSLPSSRESFPAGGGCP